MRQIGRVEEGMNFWLIVAFQEAKMRQKSGPAKEPAAKIVKDIRRATRRQFWVEEKIRIVLEGPRGEECPSSEFLGQGAANKRVSGSSGF
jgi:hypothetical protein